MIHWETSWLTGGLTCSVENAKKKQKTVHWTLFPFWHGFRIHFPSCCLLVLINDTCPVSKTFRTDVDHVIDTPLRDAAYPRGQMLTLDHRRGAGERWYGQDLRPNCRVNTSQPWEGVGSCGEKQMCAMKRSCRVLGAKRTQCFWSKSG